MTDQVPANINLRLALEQQALAQSKAGVSELDQALAALKTRAQDSGKAAEAALGNISRGVSGVSDSLDKELDAWDAVIAKMKTVEQQSDQMGAARVGGLRRAGGALSQLGLGGLGDTLRLGGDLEQVTKTFGELSEAASAANGGIIGLVASFGPLLPILAAVSLAVADVKMVLDLMKKAADDAAAAEKGRYDQEQAAVAQRKQNRQDIATKSPEQVKSEIDEAQQDVKDQQDIIADLQARIAQNDAAYAKLGASLNPQERARLGAIGEQLRKELLDAMERQNKAGGSVLNKGTNVLPQVEVKAAWGDLVKGVADTVKNDGKSIVENAVKLFKDTEAATKKTREAHLAAVKKEQDQEAALADKQRADTVSALQKRDDDIARINEQDFQKRAEIEQRYSDTLVDIARKAAENAADALTVLENKRADINEQFGRNEDKIARTNAQKDLEIQIKAQREERDALRSHLSSLESIRRASADKEEDAATDRNFKALFEIQRQKSRDMETENRRFSDQQRTNNEKLQQDREDAVRQRAFEHNERMIAYNQQLADAQKQYVRELQQQEIARQREIAMAQQTHSHALQLEAQSLQRQLQLRYAAADREIKLINMTEAEKYKIFVDYLAAYARASGPGPDATYSGTRTTSTRTRVNFAGGGDVEAGQRAIVNEPGSTGNEGFRSGGRSIRFPGMGMFIPSQSGTVDRNAGGGANISVVINTQALDAREVGRVVRREVLSAAKKLGIA